MTIEQKFAGGKCDLLVALHARKSEDSALRCRAEHPAALLIVTLTGTDVYGKEDIGSLRALYDADRIVALQPLAAQALPQRLRAKTVTIYQSALAMEPDPPNTPSFDICVICHLREVKDPFRAAEASRLLATESRIRVTLAGAALDSGFETRALREAEMNPRFRWIGDAPRWRIRRLMSRSRLLVLSSWTEGGANVISEALALSVPILASRIPGNIGLLGADYIGLFTPGSAEELAALMLRAEADSRFYSRLKDQCAALKWISDPALERGSWQSLIEEISK